jgi:hypothetical protein
MLNFIFKQKNFINVKKKILNGVVIRCMSGFTTSSKLQLVVIFFNHKILRLWTPTLYVQLCTIFRQ